MSMKVVIMAGGMGTRIRSVRNDIPKPMIEICGKPILQYQIENLVRCGLTEITIVTGHLGNIIKDYFGDGGRLGAKITYFEETYPLGTAGALIKMLPGNADTSFCSTVLDHDFLLLCGDIIFDIDFNRLTAFHKVHGAWATLAAHPNDHPYDSSLLITEILDPQEPGGMPVNTHRVIKWMAKEDARGWYKNLVNAGVQILSPELLRETAKTASSRCADPAGKVDLDRDVLKPNIRSGKIFAYETPEYIKDMGTPDRYYETEADMKSGKVYARNLSQKQKAVFLDRDGTINKKNGFITNPEQFELLPGVSDAVKRINQSGYLAVVVTNQPVIARGECTFGELQEIHDKMETELGKYGAFLDAVYFCPHHPEKGFAGERKDYKTDCKCRKPKPGMFLQAAADFNIDLAQSYMVGDSMRDVEAGNRAGCRKSFLLKDDFGLLEAVEEILK